MQQKFKLLAIETSCDDTAAAVVEVKRAGENRFLTIKSLSNVIHSQLDVHRPYGGVYPTLAKREHHKNLPAVVAQALNGGLGVSDIKGVSGKLDALAVTVGPGLEPALWEGVNFAQDLARKTKLPLYPVNHLAGHIYANFIGGEDSKKPQFPLIALIASGGHTLLVLMKKHLAYEVVGETLDDASGEAFDKCGRLMGLDYPAGPQIDKLSEKGDPAAFDFPRPMMGAKNLDFSFSGLKTAFLYKLSQLTKIDPNQLSLEARHNKDKVRRSIDAKLQADLAASLQAAIVEVLVAKTFQAAAKFGVKSIVAGGGVVANFQLRQALEAKAALSGGQIFLTPKNLATDNALAIAAAACWRIMFKKPLSSQTLEARADLSLDE